MKKIIRSFNLLILCAESIVCQQFISADPFNVLKIEQKQFSDSTVASSLMLKPIISSRNTSNWRLLARSEFYYNNNVPNLENMGNRYIGKGAGMFTGINLSYCGEYISFSIEPYYFINQNQNLKIENRDSHNENHPDIFNVLNDNRIYLQQPYKSFWYSRKSAISSL